jgi:hypothetical protein
MHSTLTTRRASLVMFGVLAFALLLLWIAGPALAAPRAGITVARGVPAEAVAGTPASGTLPIQPLGSASIAAPLGASDTYLTVSVAAAWAIGVLGAIVLLGGAGAFALAERRARGGRVTELDAAHPPAAGDREALRNGDRRKAA